MEMQEVSSKLKNLAKKNPKLFWGSVVVAGGAGVYFLVKGGSSTTDTQPDYAAALQDYGSGGGSGSDYGSGEGSDYDWGETPDYTTPGFLVETPIVSGNYNYNTAPVFYPEIPAPVTAAKAVNNGSLYAADVPDYKNDASVYYGEPRKNLSDGSAEYIIGAIENLQSNPTPDITRSYNMDEAGNYTYGEVSYPNMYAPGSKWYDAPGRVAPSWYTGEKTVSSSVSSAPVSGQGATTKNTTTNRDGSTRPKNTGMKSTGKTDWGKAAAGFNASTGAKTSVIRKAGAAR